MYIYSGCDLSKKPETFFCNRRMQRAARSGFATSTVRECTPVLDRTGAGTRPEIDRDAPPPFRFFTTNLTIILTDLYPLGRPLHAVCLHQAVIETELPRLELEQQGFVPAGADNGAELVEIHDHAEPFHAFNSDRVGTGIPKRNSSSARSSKM